MNIYAENFLTERLSVCSSLADDGRHLQDGLRSYEWWYFDALSDDGKDAIVINFSDNSIDSPRYNQGTPGRFPSVLFNYFREGRIVCRSLEEFDKQEFSGNDPDLGCRIGENSITFHSAAYGSGYVISINAQLPRGRQLEAKLEWLFVESDFRAHAKPLHADTHRWNLVSPRADVTGKIQITDRGGKSSAIHHFRGTGYHDHNIDDRYFADMVAEWHRGRAHFADATAVYGNLIESYGQSSSARLMVVRNGELLEREVEFEVQETGRSRYGAKYPTRVRLVTEDNMRLRIKQLKVIDASLYGVRALSEMTLTLRDGIPRKTTGISEYISPKNPRFRILNWWDNIRAGFRM